MALEVLQTPQGQSDAGLFNLPPAFDSKTLAAEWVPEDQVQFKRQRQNLPQTGMTADGWEVWKSEENKKPTVVKAGGNKTFVLMCRPAVIQAQVNALFGNVSKGLISREIKGETAAGEAIQDSGILTEQRLRSVVPGENGGDGELVMNDVQAAGNVEATATT